MSVGRWTTVTLAASASLLVIAGAQRSTWIGQQFQQVQQTGIVRWAGWNSAGSTAPEASAAPQPFAGVRSPEWSRTDVTVTQLQERLKAAEDPVAYAQLGSLYLQKARETGDPSYYPKAEGVLHKSLELAPHNAQATMVMGGLHMARHAFVEALEWGERARLLAPRSHTVYGIIGDASIELGKYAEAVDALQTMVDLRPDLSSLSRVSYARELHGDLPGAIDAMTKAANAGAARSEATGWTRVQLGNLYFISGDLESATREYQLTLAALPNYVHAVGGLAKVAAARGNLKEATTLYTQALDIVPVPEYAIALGDVYRAAGNAAAAAKQDQLVRVLAQLQRANGVDVDLEMALFEADHANDSASLAAAIQSARVQYEQRPSIYAADALAWTLYRAGQPVEALPYAREALRLGTKDPLVLFHAGTVAAAANQPAEAHGYLDDALKHNPNFHVRYAPEAKRLLDQLKRSGA